MYSDAVLCVSLQDIAFVAFRTVFVIGSALALEPFACIGFGYVKYAPNKCIMRVIKLHLPCLEAEVSLFRTRKKYNDKK